MLSTPPEPPTTIPLWPEPVTVSAMRIAPLCSSYLHPETLDVAVDHVVRREVVVALQVDAVALVATPGRCRGSSCRGSGRGGSPRR